MQSDTRPRYLNLFRIHLPLPGFVSILHRISGLLLVLSIPFALYLLELSLRNAQGFDRARAWLDCFWLKPVLILLAWSVSHHLFAGLRFLLLDMDIGIDRPAARAGAWAVLALSLLATLAAAWAIW